MKLSRRRLMQGFVGTAVSQLSPNVAAWGSPMSAGDQSGALPTAGRSFRFFTGTASDVSVPERWNTDFHQTISSTQFRSIEFIPSGHPGWKNPGAEIYFRVTDDPESDIHVMSIPGLTRDKFIRALATEGELVDLTPQGMQVIKASILIPEEWQTLSTLHLRARVLGFKPPSDPFIKGMYEEIEVRPDLLMIPGDHPGLVKAIRREYEDDLLHYEEGRARLAVWRLRLDTASESSRLTVGGGEMGMPEMGISDYQQRLLGSAIPRISDGSKNENADGDEHLASYPSPFTSTRSQAVVAPAG